MKWISKSLASISILLGIRLDRLAADAVGRTFVVDLGVAKLVDVQRHAASGTIEI
jgi:hypothetical protein